MKARRGPWLSGLIAAVIGAVWMIGQVVGGLGSMAADDLTVTDSSAVVPDSGFDGSPH